MLHWSKLRCVLRCSRLWCMCMLRIGHRQSWCDIAFVHAHVQWRCIAWPELGKNQPWMPRNLTGLCMLNKILVVGDPLHMPLPIEMFCANMLAAQQAKEFAISQAPLVAVALRCRPPWHSNANTLWRPWTCLWCHTLWLIDLQWWWWWWSRQVAWLLANWRRRRRRRRRRSLRVRLPRSRSEQTQRSWRSRHG